MEEERKKEITMIVGCHRDTQRKKEREGEGERERERERERESARYSEPVLSNYSVFYAPV